VKVVRRSVIFYDLVDLTYDEYTDIVASLRQAGSNSLANELVASARSQQNGND